MKHLFLHAGLLGLASCSNPPTEKPAADAWQPFVVDKQLTVQLPGLVRELNVGPLLGSTQHSAHARAWMARAPEGLCVVMRIPVINARRIAQQDTAQIHAFYQDVVRGILAEEEHAHLLKHSYFQTASGSGAEIMYTAWNAVAGQRRVRYMRSLALDSIGYNLIFRPTNKLDSTGTAGAAQRRRFFDSITVKP